MAITILGPTFNLPIGPLASLSLYITATVDALERAIVMANLPGQGRTELIHDGTSFGYLYELGTRTDYTDPMTGGVGFSYTIKRRGGWPDAVVNLHVIAYDVAGGEQLNY